MISLTKEESCLGKSPFRIELSEDERRALSTVAARYSSPYRDVVRAKVVLYAAQGLSNEEIAARVDLPRQIVSKWRKRFFEQGLEGLKEAPRQGRPRVFSPTGGDGSQGGGLRAAEDS